MDWKADILPWGTFGAAIVAALAGVSAQAQAWLDRQDRIHVAAGPILANMSNTTDLYVVNLSKHPVEIMDFGFVLHSGKLMSLPWAAETDGLPDDGDGYFTSGNRTLQPRESFQAGAFIPGTVAGLYAMTTTHRKPVYALYGRVSPWQAMRLWYMVRCRGQNA